MIKSIFQNPFHWVIASSLLQRIRWCNVNEYLSNIFIFSIPCHSKVKHLSFLWHNSPPSLASEALFGVTTLPATEKTRSLLLLAIGIAKTTLTRKARRGSASWWFFHQFSWSISEGASGITFSYVEHSLWKLLVGVVVKMMWFDQDTKQKQKSRKIPVKFLNNPGIENKGKSRPEKSRDWKSWSR